MLVDKQEMKFKAQLLKKIGIRGDREPLGNSPDSAPSSHALPTFLLVICTGF